MMENSGVIQGDASLHPEFRGHFGSGAAAGGEERQAAVVAGEVVSIMVHGLRNSLASIGSSAELLLENDILPENRLLAQEIVEHVEGLERRTRRFVAALAAGDGVASTAEPQVVVSDVLEGLRALIGRREIRLEVTIEDGCPSCKIDPGMLAEVVRNLAVNAVEALDVGGLLRIRVARGPAHTVLISIADNGHGMGRQVLEQAMQGFCTTKPHGIGVGLSLSHRIVDRQGGKLTIDSAEGQGTTADIVLPAVHAPAWSNGARRASTAPCEP